MTQFEVGDWVIITHTGGPQKLCVVGRVVGPSGRHYPNGICLDDIIVHHDPADVDGPYSPHPNEWPTQNVGVHFTIERLGAGPEPAV